MQTGKRTKAADDVIQSVAMALQIMERLATSRTGKGLSELAREVNTTKTRVLRHLRTLAKCGYVIQDSVSDKYRSGTKLIALGQAVVDNLDLIVLARPYMEMLREQLGHTVCLSLFREETYSVVDVITGKSPLKISPRPGAVISMHSTAQGKVALAFGPPTLIARVLAERSLAARTPYTLTKPTAIRKAIAEIRSQGWGVAPQEVQLGMNALAAPIFDHRGQFAGTITILGLLDSIPAAPQKKQIAAVVEAAQQVSRALGYEA